MTTTVFLVRHGAHALLGRVLCGRMAGVELDATGQAQAARAAERLQGEGVGVVYASPLERARQTAEPIAAALDAPLKIAEALNEIDLGAWTGARMEELQEIPAWRFWNSARTQHRPPGGESMVEVQVRIARWLGERAAEPGDQRIAVVCHADVIKAAICHASGLSLDHHHRLEIGPGSISVIVAGDWGMKVQSMNEAPR